MRKVNVIGVISRAEGRFERNDSRLDITWVSPPGAKPEQWDLRLANQQLFVSVNGMTIEFWRHSVYEIAQN